MAVTPGQFLKCRHENSTKETNMTTQFKIKRASQTLFIVLIAVCCGAILAPVHAQRVGTNKGKIAIPGVDLPGLGGTSNGGNSINDQSWVAGYSRLPGIRTGTLRCGETVRSPTSAHLADQTAVSHGT